MLEAFKGESKLGGNRTPKQRANPRAMSVYPEKSKYICSVKPTAAIYAVKSEASPPVATAS